MNKANTIKKAISALMCFALVASATSLAMPKLSAAEEANQITKTREEQLFNYGYDDDDVKVFNINKDSSGDDLWNAIYGQETGYYRGSSYPVKDPDDENNNALLFRPGRDVGFIVPGDRYTAVQPSQYIKAQKNVTYKVSFKWKANGVQGSASSKIFVCRGKDIIRTEDWGNIGEVTQDEKLVREIKAGEENTGEWINETFYYTVDETADLATYPNIFIKVQNYGDRGTLMAYFDDISVTSLARYTETLYADNGFEKAAAIKIAHTEKDTENENLMNWHWSSISYNGALAPTYDPLDENNIVVRHRALSSDVSVIRPAFDYRRGEPDKNITAEAGKTYEIKFKWLTEGKAKETPEFGVALARTKTENANACFNADDISDKLVVKSIPGDTPGTMKWQEETVYYTVPEDADIKNFPNLVVFANRGGSYNGYSADGCGMSIYFDNIIVKTNDKIEEERFTDEVLADNGFEKAAAIKIAHTEKDTENENLMNWHWSSISYNGALAPTYDPLDENNIVVRHRALSSDVSVIRPAFDYRRGEPDKNITAEAGKTYEIKFKWLTEGKAKETPEFGVALARTKTENANACFNADDISDKLVVKSIPGDTPGTMKWQEETVYYTVPEDADIKNFPNLVVFANRGGSYNGYSADGCGMSVYFDDISVSLPAAATVNYIYKGITESKYYNTGKIENYQPLLDDGTVITWYGDDNYKNEYDFNTNYSEYKEITLYGKVLTRPGDINKDGEVNSYDLTLLRKYLLLNSEENLDYDVNGDDKVDIRDLVKLKKLLVDEFVESVNNKTVTLSLYEPEGDTYSYGVAWQSDLYNSAPIVEVLPASETDWSKAVRFTGDADASQPHETFVLKNGYSYTPETGKTQVTGSWFYSNITETHDIVTVYSNKVVINGLIPGAEYKYRVGTASPYVIGEEGKFTAYNSKDANGQDSSNFNFIFMTDTQQDTQLDSKLAWNKTLMASAANMSNAEFIALGGDIVNFNNIEVQWTELLHNNRKYVMNIPVMPTAGNHEINMVWSGLGKEYYDFNNHFNISYSKAYDSYSETADAALKNGATGTYYSYDYKNVHFVVLNSNDVYISNRAGKGYVLSDAQMKWLEEDLSAAKLNSKTKYTIVYMHHGLYSVGVAGLGGDRHETAALRPQLQGVFAKYGVNLVLNGHDHIYSRTKALDGNGNIATEGGVVYMTGAIAGKNGCGKNLFETGYTDKNNPDYDAKNGVGTNTKDKYEKIIGDKMYCWTELKVTSDGISVINYTTQNDKAEIFDEFTIK